MADADLNAFDAPSMRIVTIQESRRWRPYSTQRRTNHPPLVPWLKLSGRWLEHAGFKPRQRLKVEVQQERLVITPA